MHRLFDNTTPLPRRIAHGSAPNAPVRGGGREQRLARARLMVATGAPCRSL